MSVQLPPSLREACRLLEQARAGEALVLLRQQLLESPSCPDAQLLLALAGRRLSAPKKNWLDALFVAWAETDYPTQFWFVHEPDFEKQLLSKLGLADENAISAIREPAALSPLEAFTVLANTGHADNLAQQGMVALDNARSVLDTLWAGCFLFPHLVSADLRPLVGAARKRQWQVLSALAPNDLLIGLCAPLEVDRGTREPLTRKVLEEVLSCLRNRAEAIDLGSIYDQLVAARSATSAKARKAAFRDALSMLPDPLMELHLRAKATDSTDHSMREQIAEVLEAVGQRFKLSTTLVTRLYALALVQEACTLRATHDQSVESELAWTRRIADAGNALYLDWPIEPLLCEVIDAHAHDEVGLLERRIPPASARH